MNQTLTLFLFFLAIVAVWIVFYNLRRKQKEAEEELRKAQLSEEEKAKEEASKTQTEDSECCGQHEVCEKTNLINTNLKIDYFDDEELDVLAGRNPDDYSDEENGQLREVFETLKEYDVAGWLRSLQLRNIELPDDIKEEALLIVSDLRERENAK